MQLLEEVPAPFNQWLELRRAARRGVDVDCELMTSRQDSPIATRCTELSPYGMWLDTGFNVGFNAGFNAGVAVDPGDEVVLCFVPPRRDREVLVFGRVKRTGKTGMAIEFESLDGVEQKTLADCLFGIPPRFPGQPSQAA